MPIETDSDSSDSDYNPVNDDENEARAVDSNCIKEISYSRKRKANLIWEEMNLADREEIEKNQIKIKKSKTIVSTKVKKVLNQIFGKLQSDSILSNCKNQIESEKGNYSKNSVELKERIKNAIKNVPKKQIISETRKFAGKSVKYIYIYIYIYIYPL